MVVVPSQKANKIIDLSECKDDCYYIFDHNDTFFNYLNINIADFGKKWIKTLNAITAITHVFGFVVMNIYFQQQKNILLYPIYITSVIIIVWIPYDIITFLCLNVKAFKLVIRSTEFWIKLFYSLYGSVLNVILYAKWVDIEQYQLPTFQLVTNILIQVHINLFIVCL